jgi:hypothetical protein
MSGLTQSGGGSPIFGGETGLPLQASAGASAPTFSVVDVGGGQLGLEISGRTSDWQGIDVIYSLLGMDISSYEYHLFVSGMAFADLPGTSVSIEPRVDPYWPAFAVSTLNHQGQFALNVILCYEVLSGRGDSASGASYINLFREAVRIRTAWASGATVHRDFIITELIVVRQFPVPTIQERVEEMRDDLEALIDAVRALNPDAYYAELPQDPYLDILGLYAPADVTVFVEYASEADSDSDVEFRFRVEAATGREVVLNITTVAEFNMNDNIYNIVVAGYAAPRSTVRLYDSRGYLLASTVAGSNFTLRAVVDMRVQAQDDLRLVVTTPVGQDGVFWLYDIDFGRASRPIVNVPRPAATVVTDVAVRVAPVPEVFNISLLDLIYDRSVTNLDAVPFLSPTTGNHRVTVESTRINRRVAVRGRTAATQGLLIGNYLGNGEYLQIGDIIRIDMQVGTNICREWFAMFLNVSPAGYAPRAVVDGLRVNQRFTVEHVVSAADLTVDGFNGFVIRSNHGGASNPRFNDFFIYNINIIRLDAAAFRRDPGTVVWSLLDDSVTQGLTVGTTGRSDIIYANPLLSPSGGTYTIVAGSDGNAIQVSGRNRNWYGFDLAWRGLGANFMVHNYEITVRGRIVNPRDGEHFEFNRSTSPYGPLLTENQGGVYTLAQPDETGFFELTVPFNNRLMTRDGNAAFPSGIRFQTNMYSDFIIYDIIVTVLGAAGAVAPVIVDAEVVADEVPAVEDDEEYEEVYEYEADEAPGA